MQDSEFFNEHQNSMNAKDESYLKSLENSRVFVLSRLARNYPINYVLRVLNFTNSHIGVSKPIRQHEPIAKYALSNNKIALCFLRSLCYSKFLQRPNTQKYFFGKS
jgi:hypothetical protein